MIITKKPVNILNSRGTKKLLISCDDGNSYTVAELSILLGITTETITYRLRKWGWDHPQILRPVSTLKAHFVKKDQHDISIDIISGDCVGKYGDRVRVENLLKIPAPTRFEMGLI